MAVYTEVSEDEARALLHRLGLGELSSLRGIDGGIEIDVDFVDDAHIATKPMPALATIAKLSRIV